MPGGFTSLYGIVNGTAVGADETASFGTAVVCTVANTKGAYAQLTASTGSDITWSFVYIRTFSLLGVSFNASVDIAIGAGGSEKIIAADLIATAPTPGTYYLVPVAIPSGTRISARQQSDAAVTIQVGMICFSGEFKSDGFSIESNGFNSGTTLGTTISASASANTKGSYAQVTASTGKDYKGIMVGFDANHAGATGNQSLDFLIDIAIGAAASEKIIIPDLYYNEFSRSDFAVQGVQTPPVTVFDIKIPSGTRLSARCQCSTGSKNLNIMLYGIY